MSIRSCFFDGIVLFLYILADFLSSSLLIAEGGILKSLTIIVNLSIYLFSSTSFCFMHFEVFFFYMHISDWHTFLVD